ncbi:MAG: hypothetical protein Q4D63_00290, partial [Neisseria animaloris]|nr:hypothetical protein [Neisseria animaloris]
DGADKVVIGKLVFVHHRDRFVSLCGLFSDGLNVLKGRLKKFERCCVLYIKLPPAFQTQRPPFSDGLGE